MRIIWPVLLSVRAWQIIMVFRWKRSSPKTYIWHTTTMCRYRRWKGGSDMLAGWEY